MTITLTLAGNENKTSPIPAPRQRKNSDTTLYKRLQETANDYGDYVYTALQ